jgi:hypothetical protein
MKRQYELNKERHKELTDSWRENNREYVNENARERRRTRSPELRLEQYLRQVFNMTLDDYNALLSSQNNVCAICEQPCSTGQRLSVDHDHATGKIRGLLCRKCNSALGHFDDRLELLTRAVKYMESSDVC